MSSILSKAKATAPPDGLEFEFMHRFVTLFTSFYETPSIEEITTFPPPPPPPAGDFSEPDPRPPPFHASVWDLRLRKRSRIALPLIR
jgi:hypothetical protein